MQIKKGRSRIVVLLPRIGIVIKFPIIKLKRVWFNFIDLLLPYKRPWSPWIWCVIKSLRKYLFAYNVNVRDSFKNCIFEGIYNNWIEFWFYQKTKNIILVPTYFSLFGFFNVQRLVKSCGLDDLELWSLIYHAVDDDAIFSHDHHFHNPNNFTFENGKLKIIDYGQSDVIKLIRQFSDRLSRIEGPVKN